jgi:methylated-DNA-[protein]-cysteine S-methyltransferase
MKYDIFNSPLGLLTVSTDGANITALHIQDDRYFTAVPAGWTKVSDQPLLRRAKEQLDQYFAGRRQKFDLPLSSAGTPFQQEVWVVLRNIPAGSTVTYADIARQIGRPKAVRAVGTAVGRNPLCIIVPCHRVLGSGGGLGGYVAGVERKQDLLRLEGVTV